MVSHQNLKITVCTAILLTGVSLMFGDASFSIGLAIVIIGLLLVLWFWPIHFIWPGKESWKGELLGIRPFRYGKDADNWITDRPQQVGDSFLLVIEKAPNIFVTALKKLTFKVLKRTWILDIGKARVIDHIQFMRNENYPVVGFPIKYAVTIQGLHSIYPEWDRRELTESSPVSNIIINLGHPTKVTCIVIEIIEPRPNHHWTTGEIRIHEIRVRLSLSWGVNIK